MARGKRSIKFRLDVRLPIRAYTSWMRIISLYPLVYRESFIQVGTDWLMAIWIGQTGLRNSLYLILSVLFQVLDSIGLAI